MSTFCLEALEEGHTQANILFTRSRCLPPLLALIRQLETYPCRLLHWEQASKTHPRPWSPFLLKNRPNRKQRRYLAQQ